VCEKCKGLFTCNVHICPHGSFEPPASPPAPRVRRVFEADILADAGRTGPEGQIARPRLDTALEH